VYSIVRPPERVLSTIREGRIRAAGSFCRVRMRLSNRFFAAMYISKEGNH
jgi:hypothetical protein